MSSSVEAYFKALFYSLCSEKGQILVLKSYKVCEDPWTHEIDHLGHLIDVHSALALQLLTQGGESTQYPCRNTSKPVRTKKADGLWNQTYGYTTDNVTSFHLCCRTCAWHSLIMYNSGTISGHCLLFDDFNELECVAHRTSEVRPVRTLEMANFKDVVILKHKEQQRSPRPIALAAY